MVQCVDRQRAALNMHSTQFVGCRVHCAKVVGATSSEGCLVALTNEQ